VPTKKQRKRRKKGQRHSYEYVWVDDEGRELEVPEDEAPEESRPERPARAEKKEARKTPTGDGRLRAPQPPSIRRVLKRGAIFAPLMYVTVYLLSPDDMTTAQMVAQTLFLLMIFLPFSYAMDAMTYRVWRKRLAKAQGGGRRGG
jgi:hypothetical protein